MHLSTHSYYSLRHGTIPPEELPALVRRLGMDTLVLTDINSTSAWEMVVRGCEESGIKPVLGIEFRDRDHRFRYLGIARNREGRRELTEFISEVQYNGYPLPARAPDFRQVAIVYALGESPVSPEDLRPYEYLGVRPHQVNQLFQSEELRHPERLLAFAPLSFRTRTDFEVHQLLRAIDRNIVISKLTRADVAREDETPLTEAQFEQLYQLYPQLVHNTRALVRSCEAATLPRDLGANRRVYGGSREDDFNLVKKLAWRGYERRYGGDHPAARERIERELKVIRDHDFCGYFLITWDVVRYAQSQGYYFVGRGSGANSIVAYCLYITDVDPLELGLYFERFINPYRKSPPDFDIDFCHDELDDVRDYLLTKFGSGHAAMLASFNTFNYRSIVRELGKVFGLPKHEIDLISRSPDRAAEHHPLAQRIVKWGKHLEGFPNSLSMHPSGIVISHEPLAYCTHLTRLTKGLPVVSFDMYAGERMGFHKYDVLGQRGIGHIRDTIRLVEERTGHRPNVRRLDQLKADPRVRANLRAGHCIGCFYIESPAMRMLLGKLGCEEYVHLVAASSIIRPGVSKSGMMQEYIRRFHAPETVEYPHPIFEEQLGETFGVMVYQEDVLKILHHFAGLDLGESDVVRRIMCGKRAEGDTLRRLEEKYFRNCRERGYPDPLSQEIWRQISSFSGYSFCKAHSASYAVESFQSLYLKTYHPLEFAVSVINNHGGFYGGVQEVYFYEARRAGGQLEPPCVNHSREPTVLVGQRVYVGFNHIRQLDRATTSALLAERDLRGPFRSLADFVERVPIAATQLELLLRIGAFRFTGLNKHQLMWEKNRVFNSKQDFEATGQLFPDLYASFELPPLELAPHAQAHEELDLLNLTLQNPFDLLSAAQRPYDTVLARDLPAYAGRTVQLLGYLVCRKPSKTKRGQLMCFATWFDEELSFFDTVHFPAFLEQFPFVGGGIYRIEGRVGVEFGVCSVEVLRMWFVRG